MSACRNAMRADLSRQMKKTTDQHARIPHIDKSGTPYSKTNVITPPPLPIAAASAPGNCRRGRSPPAADDDGKG
jgi:hypothetical protein